MDTFKGQDNEAMKSLCNKNNCELVIVPHNLTNKFQLLDLSINQKAKKYVSSKFNEWYAERVSKQLMNGKAPGDVKVSLKLNDLKPLHAKWIVEMYGYLKQQNSSNVLKRLGYLKLSRWHKKCMPDVKIRLKKNDKQSLFFYFYL